MKKTDGTIVQFLEGSHSFDGVWFGEPHPVLVGQFWWRTFLRDYIRTASQSSPGSKDVEQWYHNWMAAHDKAEIATVNVLDMLKDFASQQAPEGMYTREQVKAAFDAGYKHGWGQSEFEGESVTPNFKQFIQSLKH